MTNITELAQRTDLLMDNALETAKQLRELSESTVADAIFESIVENENGKEIQFERPISDLAYAAFLKLERLVEALEKAQRANAAQDDHINQQQDRIDQLEKKNAGLGKYVGKMESRTVTIEPFRSFVTDADLSALHRFAECCDDPESGGHDLEKEQVRRLESIGALQRSGRISYITGFGNFLISITAGIKWEAE